MNVFDVLTLVGGLCLFLFGMNVMGDALERRAGNSLKAILGANIGTTVTAWILSLGGISGDNLILQLLKPMSLT